MWRRLFRPSVILPVVLSAALLAALFTLGNSQRIVADIFSFKPGFLLWIAALLLVYEAARAVQWLFLLRELGVQAPLKSQAFAFLIGEGTRSLPLGNYLPNYLLRYSSAVQVGLSSAATTAMVLFEVAVTLTLLVLLGLGSWTGWLRPLILGGTGLVLLVAWALVRLRGFVSLPASIARHAAVRRLRLELRAFRKGARRLWRPRVLVIGTLTATIYTVAAGAALFAVVRGLGVGGITLWQVLAVYSFSLAAGLIEPSPIDMGVIEVSGVGAFLAFGVSPDEAVSAMLINRALSIVAGLLVAGATMLVMPRELRQLRHAGGPAPDGLAA